MNLSFEPGNWPAMDLEGFAKRGLKRNDPEIESKLISLIREVKEIPEEKAATLACSRDGGGRSNFKPQRRGLPA